MVADPATLTPEFVAACQSNSVTSTIMREALVGATLTGVTPTSPTLVLWGEDDRHAS